MNSQVSTKHHVIVSIILFSTNFEETHWFHLFIKTTLTQPKKTSTLFKQSSNNYVQQKR